MSAAGRPGHGVLQALRFDAVKARVAGLWPRDASEGGALPVRDWINVTSGSPTRVLAFDQALLALFEWLGQRVGGVGRCRPGERQHPRVIRGDQVLSLKGREVDGRAVRHGVAEWTAGRGRS